MTPAARPSAVSGLGSPDQLPAPPRRRRWPVVLAALMATAALLLPAGWLPQVIAASPCGPESNEIVCENSKAGASWQDWEIQGAGDSSIQGFATAISVNVGERIDFKIDTDAPDYDIDIYRTGWYQGLGARLIDSVEPAAALPQIQLDCRTDATVELTDCGNWEVSASWDVPADAVSGVYIAKLTRADTGGASHITFIVRKDGNTSDVVFQTSDTTWHAYNTYGGSDFYTGAANGRAYKISYNRPFATRGGIEARDFYFGNEYPLVRFMERNGYDVSYIAGVDADRDGAQLLNHTTYLSVGHDEYWSGAQRTNVEAARDAGVHLQFLSGNEMYWRVRYEPSSTDPDGDQHRTLVSYKETWSHAKIDPASEWTGTFRDPRFAATEDGAGQPENALTGTAYVVNYGDFPITVNDHEGDLRIWRDTGLSDLPAGGSAELAEHTVGYESNEDLPNGFRPPGLIRLSTTTGEVPEYLQDFGNTVAAGTTTHHTTLYKAPSGALVFSAGSVQWTWGLDEWHDGDGGPADPRMQQAQVNLFADMGVQPATLMNGLAPAAASTDTVAPSLTVTQSPAGPLPHGTEVTVAGTATDGTGPETGQVAGVEYSVDAGATWAAADGTSNWSFRYLLSGVGQSTVLVRAIDDSGNYPAQGTPVNTEVTGPYSVFGDVEPGTADTGDASSVELGLRFSPTVDGVVTGVRFHRSAANTGQHTGTLWSLDGNSLATVRFPETTDTGWVSAEFSAPVAVQAGTDYVVSYSAPAGRYAADPYHFAYRGVDGSPLSVAGGYGVAQVGVYDRAGTYPARSFQNANYYVDALFTPATDLPLTASTHRPADTTVSVPTSTPITTVFSREVVPSSVSLTLRQDTDSSGAGGTAVAGTASYDPLTRTATFTPSAALPEGTRFTAVAQAADAAGETLSAGTTWSFRTWSTASAQDGSDGLLPETYLPVLSSVDDGVPVTLGTRFVPTKAGVVEGLEFYRAPGTDTGQTGALFTGGGTLLAEVTFPDDSATGWQYAALGTPVRLQPGSEYVVAYTTQQYSVSPGYWNATRSVGPLRVDDTSGQYSYGSPVPTSSVSTNYLVDVRFAADLAAPTVLERTPLAGTTDAPADTPVSITFDQAIHATAAMTVTANGTAAPGTTTRSADGTSLVWTPDQPLADDARVSVRLTGAAAAAATDPSTVPDLTWIFRVAGTSRPPVSTFLGDPTPSSLVSGDTQAVELGVQLTTSAPITVEGLRYHRGTDPGAGGTGTIWSAEGTALATVDFGTDTDPGWHTALLDEPLSLAAGTTFTISRHSPDGGYAYTSGGFTDGHSAGALNLTEANGRFVYGSGGVVPTQTWGSTNYFVDLLYTED